MLILLKIIDSILVSFTNGALQNDPVDEGGWFSQVLASRKTAAEYTLLTKISILSSCLKALRKLRNQRQKQCKSVKSVAKNLFVPWCLSGESLKE